MNKIFIVMLLFLFTKTLFAQKMDSVRFKNNALYVELFGNSGLGIISANYEKKIFQNNNCFYTVRTGVAFSNYPILINRIAGLRKNHFEVGTGVILDRYGDHAITGNVMYRYQKPQGKFIFRIGWTPSVFLNQGSYKYGYGYLFLVFCGISAGYAF